MSKSKNITETDGLRRVNKDGGKFFGYSPYASSTLSCYKCGRHKLKSGGGFKRLLGRSMFICGECKSLTLPNLQK